MRRKRTLNVSDRSSETNKRAKRWRGKSPAAARGRNSESVFVFFSPFAQKEDSLVPRSSEMDRQRPFGFDVGTVDQNIGLGQEGVPVGIRRLANLFVEVAGIDYHVFAVGVAFLRKSRQGTGVQERFSPRKSHAGYQRVRNDSGIEFVNRHRRTAPRKSMRFGVMTAAAVVGAPLGKDHKAHPRSVGNRFRLNTRDKDGVSGYA